MSNVINYSNVLVSCFVETDRENIDKQCSFHHRKQNRREALHTGYLPYLQSKNYLKA